jgi:hypothetical protein
MNKFKLIRYDDPKRDAWNAVVFSSKNGNFLHLREYIDYHVCRFDEQSLIIEKKGYPVAIFPCNKIDGKIISHGGLTYAGLIYSNKLHATEIIEIFLLLLEHYRSQGCSCIIYKAIPHVFHSYPSEEDLYALYRLQAKLIRRDIASVIELNGSRPKLSDSRKCTINKAIKNEVAIKEGFFFDSYHALISVALSKFNTNPVHSLGEMRMLNSKFPEQIRLFGAFVEQELLAGVLIYDFGQIVHTQYMASSGQGRKIGALDYIISHLIDAVYSDRRYFSFGISTEQNGNYLNEGLIYQKEGFGGRGITFDHYELDLTC